MCFLNCSYGQSVYVYIDNVTFKTILHKHVLTQLKLEIAIHFNFRYNLRTILMTYEVIVTQDKQVV